MGYRTLVILNNDHNWEQDSELGKKIQNAAFEHQRTGETSWFDSGSISQVCHADVKSVMIIDLLCATELGGTHYTQSNLEALRRAAENFGYRLSKIPE